MLVLFSIIYIILMGIIQIDYISPLSLVIAAIISYKLTPYIIKWFLSNNIRVYDNWF
jgi:hypothetical protein